LVGNTDPLAYTRAHSGRFIFQRSAGSAQSLASANFSADWRPLLRLSRNLGPRIILCRWADLNVEAEVADAVGELGRGTGWVTAGEVIGTEILVAGAVSKHVVGGG